MAAKTNTPKLKGMKTGKPSGNSAVVPAGQYPTILGTKGIGANAKANLDALTGGQGSSTVNSRPTN